MQESKQKHPQQIFPLYELWNLEHSISLCSSSHCRIAQNFPWLSSEYNYFALIIFICLFVWLWSNFLFIIVWSDCMSSSWYQFSMTKQIGFLLDDLSSIWPFNSSNSLPISTEIKSIAGGCPLLVPKYDNLSLVSKWACPKAKFWINFSPLIYLFIYLIIHGMLKYSMIFLSCWIRISVQIPNLLSSGSWSFTDSSHSSLRIYLILFNSSSCFLSVTSE